MSLKISRRLLGRLHALAAVDPAHEICGLLLGDDAAIAGIVEADNVAPKPDTTFEIDPVVQIGAIKAARAGGPRLIGCYHSHPGSIAAPSQTDLDLAQSGSIWLILAKDDITAWRRSDTDFQSIHLDVC